MKWFTKKGNALEVSGLGSLRLFLRALSLNELYVQVFISVPSGTGKQGHLLFFLQPKMGCPSPTTACARDTVAQELLCPLR